MLYCNWSRHRYAAQVKYLGSVWPVLFIIAFIFSLTTFPSTPVIWHLIVKIKQSFQVMAPMVAIPC